MILLVNAEGQYVDDVADGPYSGQPLIFDLMVAAVEQHRPTAGYKFVCDAAALLALNDAAANDRDVKWVPVDPINLPRGCYHSFRGVPIVLWWTVIPLQEDSSTAKKELLGV